MSSDELSLTWDDHHNTLVKVFGKLLDTSSLVDCTIAAEGRYIKAHKIILSACSPYFELLFNQENEKNPIVVLKDIKFQELKAIIDFIYCGKVRVPEDRLGDFVDAAESLQIKGLGGDNYQIPSSEQISERSESPHPPKQELSDSSSPVPRKRRRPLSVSEDNVSEISSGTNVNDEYQSLESVSQGQMQVERLGHQIGQHSSTASASNRLCSPSVTVHSKQRIVETDSPASFTEPSPPPPTLEILPNPDTMVIKTEPEPIAEVFLPEMDFEPKGEQEEDDAIVLDSEGEGPGTVLNVDSQSSSNQYSAFPTALQTAAAGSESAFLMTDVAEHSSTQGTSMALTKSGGQSSPTTTERMRPGAHALRDFPASVIHRVAAPRAVTAASINVNVPPAPAASASTSRTADARQPTTHGCLVCGMAFPTPSALARHLWVHTDDRPFKCYYCDKAFAQKGDVDSHLRTHRAERPNRCDECGYTTVSSTSLEIHKRLVHGAPTTSRRSPHN